MKKLFTSLLVAITALGLQLQALGQSTCAPDYYRNKDGQCIHRPAHSKTKPKGATARCADGTYSFSRHRPGTCSGRGGVINWLDGTAPTNSNNDGTQPPNKTNPQSTTPAATCAPDHYLNSSGQCVQRPVSADTPPVGATAQCRDGTYSFSQHRSGTCSHHGGVAKWL